MMSGVQALVASARRIGVLLAGSILFLAGIALLVLPGPGSVIIAGLALLGTQSPGRGGLRPGCASVSARRSRPSGLERISQRELPKDLAQA